MMQNETITFRDDHPRRRRRSHYEFTFFALCLCVPPRSINEKKTSYFCCWIVCSCCVYLLPTICEILPVGFKQRESMAAFRYGCTCACTTKRAQPNKCDQAQSSLYISKRQKLKISSNKSIDCYSYSVRFQQPKEVLIADKATSERPHAAKRYRPQLNAFAESVRANLPPFLRNKYQCFFLGRSWQPQVLAPIYCGRKHPNDYRLLSRYDVLTIGDTKNIAN